MEQEKLHFSTNSGVVLIVLGIVAIVYSTIIPVVQYPYNVFASWFFLIGGIIFITVGILLIFTMKRRYHSHETEGGLKNEQ